MKQVVVIDYGAGNLGSIVNMVKRIGGEAKITSSPSEVESAEKLILPGVGHFDFGMSQLMASGLIDILNRKVLQGKTPILGICLGAQLMTLKSEEGSLAGLGWFDAEVKKFAFTNDNDLRIPHMGWNNINVRQQMPVLKNLPNNSRFYFVHSYYMEPNVLSDVMLTTKYGFEFASALGKDNIYAVQFHPEKSHKYGLQLLKNFVNL